MAIQAPTFTRSLARPRLGVAHIVFFVVTASGPLIAVAGGVSTTYAVTGIVGVPLSFVLLAPVLALFAVGYAAMSRYITNAGAFYPYVAHGLGRSAGVAVAFVALLAYNAIQIGIYGLFGWSIQNFILSKTGVDTPWWLWSLVALLVVAAFGLLRVDINAKVLGVVLIAEIVAVLIIDGVSFANPGTGGVALAPLDPSTLFVAGVGSVFAFSVAAFTGFEGAATYGEECREPSRTVARATYIAIGLTALLYTLSALAMAVASGSGNIVAQAQEQGPNLLFSISGAHLGSAFTDVAYILFLTSQFACLLSFHNAVSRYFFALGREGVLPAALGRTDRRSGSPIGGSATQSVLALVVVVAFAVAGRDPVLELFTWLSNTASTGVVLIMACVSVAVVGFFRKRPAVESAWRRVVAPSMAAILLFTLLGLIIANFDNLLGPNQGVVLRWLLPGLLVVAALAGFARSAALRRNKPDAYANVGGIGDPTTLTNKGI